MPYIKQSEKDYLNDYAPIDISCEHPGHLNYLFTVLINNYIEYHGLSYRTINDCLGALEGCKLELYRRTAVPYEKKKMKENGDV